MSSIQYLPIPPRVWSRVQNDCSAIDNATNSSDYAINAYKKQENLKGNILQYKKNSSNLTKKQRYSQIAKGMWASRTKTWATQTQSYSNPNTLSLKRVNYTFLDPSNNAFSQPLNPFYYFGCRDNNLIRDGGNLICNTTVNPCTDQVIKKTLSQKLCNPTTDSNVPGPVTYLCWNDGQATWYPRQRYVMPTSGNKFPINYKFLVSAVRLSGPKLTVGPLNCFQTEIPLSWTKPTNVCFPITSYEIYQNGVLIETVPSSETSTVIRETQSGNYVFYIAAVNNSLDSVESNTVTVNTEIGYTIEGPYGLAYDGTTVTLTFSEPGATTTLTLNCPIKNQTITCIGGGGGGGGGSNKQSGNPTLSAGGGGGGGAIAIVSGSLLSIGNTNTIIVGKKGTAGGGNLGGANGTSSSFSNNIGSITSNGGNGGAGHYSASSGGAGGTAIIQNFVGGTIYNGGTGGNGYQQDNPAVTPTNGNASLTSYSGGGGGGTSNAGGNAAYLGSGGAKGGQGSTTGQNAQSISYGSGGGGAGCPSSTGQASYGGAGANGIVILSFQYP